MSEPEQGTNDPAIAPAIAPAVAAAIRDILAALAADAGTEAPRPFDPGDPVGHGTIRLRGRPDGPAAVPVAGEPVGHGTIRLRGRREAPAPVAFAFAAEPVGHGRIRLHGRPLESPATAAGALDPRADILAAFAAHA